MARGTPAAGYTCRVCGQTGIATFGDLGKHLAEHRRAERAGIDPTPKGPRVRKHRPIEDVFGAGPALAAGEGPGEPSPVSGDGPAGPAPSPSRPTVAAPSIRISPEQRQLSVNDAIRDALPVATLADILVALSRSISDMDGAGEAGVLSPIQATQIAVLLYDSTIDLVVTRFNGDVTRFKAGLAVVLVLLSKGTIHARAIRAKVAERRAAGIAAEREALILGNREGQDVDVEPTDVFAAATAREARMRAALNDA